MGDVKLFGIIGFYAGFQDFILIITIASVIAIVASIFKFHTLKIPYGAYISMVMVIFIFGRLFNYVT